MTTAVATDQITGEDMARMIHENQNRPAVAAFHAIWYQAKTTWAMTRYKGVPTLKCAEDLQIYHEILWQLRPRLVIETGTCFGGSALWFADQIEPWAAVWYRSTLRTSGTATGSRTR